MADDKKAETSKTSPKKVVAKEVASYTKTLKINEAMLFDPQGYSMEVENLGGGDVYVGTKKEPVPSPKTLLKVGDKRKFNENVKAFAYSRPTLKITLYE